MLSTTGGVWCGAEQKVKRKLYYGWVVAIIAAGAMFAAGNFQYIFGVFFRPLIDNFGWSRAAISGSVSLRNITSAVVSPVIGSLSDRLGAKKFIIAGVFLVGLSYLLVSRISNLWELYLSLGLLTGMGISMVVVPTVATVTRWFGGKSALANGIVFAGFGLAQVILPPLATIVILNQGWTVCFVGFAALAWVGGGAAWYFIKLPPAAESKAQESGTSQKNAPSGNTTIQDEGTWTLSAVLRTPTLWNLVTVYVVVALCYQIIMIHIVAAAIDVGINPAAAAIILTLSGITNTAGRLLVSSLARWIGNKRVLVYCLAVQAVLLFLLMGAHSLYAFYIITAIYGLFYGGVPPMMPTISGEYFGTKSMGGIFGMITFAYTIGAAIGPLAAGYIFDVTGRYYIAFLSAAIAMALAFLLSLTLKPPQKRGLT